MFINVDLKSAGAMSMNVLVVEDDREMAELLVRGLREEAHQVNLARDGRAALAISNDAAFDVILLDVMLPGMDGLEVAKQLRLRRDQVPVLMLTDIRLLRKKLDDGPPPRL